MIRTYALLLSALALPALAADYDIDSAHSAAQFSVRHLMVSNVRGEFSKVSGKVVYDAVVASGEFEDVAIIDDALRLIEQTRGERLECGLELVELQGLGVLSRELAPTAELPSARTAFEGRSSGGRGLEGMIADVEDPAIGRGVDGDRVQVYPGPECQWAAEDDQNAPRTVALGGKDAGDLRDEERGALAVALEGLEVDG